MAFSFLEFLSVLEILSFMYYANEEGNDVIGGSTETVYNTLSSPSLF